MRNPLNCLPGNCFKFNCSPEGRQSRIIQFTKFRPSEIVFIYQSEILVYLKLFSFTRQIGNRKLIHPACLPHVLKP